MGWKDDNIDRLTVQKYHRLMRYADDIAVEHEHESGIPDERTQSLPIELQLKS
jgi:hypothetical protein